LKVKKIRQSFHVRVEELLPCPTFSCIHDSMVCAIRVWCPDGCFDTNEYITYCIPKCMDCIHYAYKCNKWRTLMDGASHSALSGRRKEYYREKED